MLIVHSCGGFILNILHQREWSPDLTLASLVNAVLEMLTDPLIGCNMNVEADEAFQNNREKIQRNMSRAYQEIRDDIIDAVVYTSDFE